jgi:hypothetical protein
MWILFPDEILVEPVCLFDLEADSWYRYELFGGDVDNKSTRRCGCQCYGLWKGGEEGGREGCCYQDKSSRTCSKEAN